MFQAASALADRCLVHIVDGIKPQAADRTLKAPAGPVPGAKQDPVDETAGRQPDRVTRGLNKVERLLLKTTLPVEEVVSRFLDQLDEMDTEEYQTVLERLTAMAPDTDPVRQSFRAQVVARMRKDLASDMDTYALRALDDIAKVCTMASPNIPDFVDHSYGFVWLRSKLLERHPEAVAASSRETDRRIQRWLARQTLEVREDVTHVIKVIADSAEREGAYPAETRLRAFCLRLLAALAPATAQ